MLETTPLSREREQRRQQVVGHAIPARGDGMQRPVGLEPVVDLGEGRVDRGAPGGGIERRIVDERPGQRAQRTESGQLASGRRRVDDRDVMGPEELDRVSRCIEVVVGRIAGPRPPTVMGAGPVLAVGQSQDGVGSQS